ncbi:hypothetical protein ACO0QE_002922 [Hanseniaspora vineae]
MKDFISKIKTSILPSNKESFTETSLQLRNKPEKNSQTPVKATPPQKSKKNPKSRSVFSSKHKIKDTQSSLSFNGLPIDFSKNKELKPEIRLKIVNQPLAYEPGDYIEGEVHLKLKCNVTNLQLDLTFQGIVTLRGANKKQGIAPVQHPASNVDHVSKSGLTMHGNKSSGTVDTASSHTDTKNDMDVNNDALDNNSLQKKTGVNANILKDSNNNVFILFDKQIFLYGEDTTGFNNNNTPVINGLTSGEHIFPFKIRIPSGRNKSVYSSISFEKGSVRYSLNSSLYTIFALPSDIKKDETVNNDRSQLHLSNAHELSANLQSQNNARPHPISNISKKLITTYSKEVFIIEPIDVSPYIHPVKREIVLGSPEGLSQNEHNEAKNEQSPIKEQTCIEQENRSRFSDANQNIEAAKSKVLKFEVELDHKGYRLGDKINMKFKLQHYKNFVYPIGVIATLLRICEVDNAQEFYRKDICQTTIPIATTPVPVNSTTEKGESFFVHQYEQNLSLKVPLDILPSLNMKECKFFQFKYYVELTVNLSQKNQVMTENNHILCGKYAPKATSHYKKEDLKFKNYQNVFSKSNKDKRLKELIALQKKVLSKRTVSDDYTVDNPLECYFYQDLVDVAKLNKGKNVTSLMTEIVVGTYRKTIANVESPGASSLVNNAATPAGELRATVENIYNQLAKNITDTDIGLPDSYPFWSTRDQLPEYSAPPDASHGVFGASDNKEELEKQRLQNLESEPPM